MKKVLVVGGGASGLFATISSLDCGNEVMLFEKNEKLGKKIYITGKGRCNLTNDVEPFEFINNVCVNPKFLFSAINALSPQKTQAFFKKSTPNRRCADNKLPFAVEMSVALTFSDGVKSLAHCNVNRLAVGSD